MIYVLKIETRDDSNLLRKNAPFYKLLTVNIRELIWNVFYHIIRAFLKEEKTIHISLSIQYPKFRLYIQLVLFT